MPYFSQSDAREAIKLALGSVQELKCGKEPCEAATTEEFVSPPIEADHARLALIGGARSARLQWCGLEWQKRILPALIQSFQEQGIHSRRSLAMLKLIHDVQFKKDFAGLQILKTCSEEQKAKLDKQSPVIVMPPWQGAVNNALLDTSVAQMIQRVLGDISQTNCGGKFCEPATAEEKANPPVSIDQARQAMKVGISAGVAQFCELDWRSRIFLPFMGYHQHTSKMEPRQLSIMAMLFATMQGFMLESYKKHEKTCSAQMKDRLEHQFSKS